ncbi:MAG: DUF1189 family protein [Wujia sp.]
MTFAEQIVYGWFCPSRYKDLLELKRGRFVSYVIVMMLALGIVGYAVPVASTISGFGGFETLFTDNLGTVSYEKGALSVEHQFNMHINYANVLIDTTKETIPNEDLKKEGMFLAIGSKTLRMTAVIGSEITDYQVYHLDELLFDGFTNQTLVDMIPSIYVTLVIMFLANTFGYFLKYGFIALLFYFLVNSMNKQFDLNLQKGQSYALCFYGQSFAMIISNFNQAAGLLPAMLVSIIGMFVTVHMITASVAYLKNAKEF